MTTLRGIIIVHNKLYDQVKCMFSNEKHEINN